MARCVRAHALMAGEPPALPAEARFWALHIYLGLLILDFIQFGLAVRSGECGFIVPNALVQNYAPSVQDFQLRHISSA